MKKLFVITTLAVAVSLSSSFGTGRIEVIARPSYDDSRDQQWRQAQVRQQREDQIRQQREDQRRQEWLRARWEHEQQDRRRHNQRPQPYEFWIQVHLHDYDNSR